MKSVKQDVKLEGYSATLSAVVGKKPKEPKGYRYLNIYISDCLDTKPILTDTYILTDTADGNHVLMDAKGGHHPLALCPTYEDCQKAALDHYVKSTTKNITVI